MGLLFTHKENEKWHIYRMRSKSIWFGYPIFSIIVFLLSLYFASVYDATKIYYSMIFAVSLLVLFFILLAVLAIDYIPIWLRMSRTRWSGKKEIITGTPRHGDYEMKLEK